MKEFDPKREFLQMSNKLFVFLKSVGQNERLLAKMGV